MNEGHFKLGLFVTMAVVLLVVFLLTLGPLERFQPRVRAETYFPASIQNLQTGAPVRFRGVNVGTVRWIGFAAQRYPEAPKATQPGGARSLIMVELRLFVEALAHAGVQDVRAELEASIEQGLRARLSQSGLGGPAFIEVDYLDPELFPSPEIDWTPKNIHVPSVPSTIGSLVDSAVSLLRKLDAVDFGEFAGIGDALARVADALDESGLLDESSAALAELRAASAEARRRFADPRLDAVLDDAGATLEGTRALLEGDHSQVTTLIDDLGRMSNTLDRAGTSLDALASKVDDSGLVERLQTLADELGPAGSDLSSLADRLDRLVRANDQEIADAIRSLRDAALELRALLEELKANPSRILADPPSRRTPTGTSGGTSGGGSGGGS